MSACAYSFEYVDKQESIAESCTRLQHLDSEAWRAEFDGGLLCSLGPGALWFLIKCTSGIARHPTPNNVLESAH